MTDEVQGGFLRDDDGAVVLVLKDEAAEPFGWMNGILVDDDRAVVITEATP